VNGVRMSELYRAIWRVTGRQQLVLIVLSVLVAAVAALPLRFQQLAINSLVYGSDVRQLAWLCAGFLVALLLSAGLKLLLGLRMATVGERVVLLIRERIYRNATHDRVNGAGDAPTPGTLVAMVSAEAESVGSFAGAAIASPVVQIGTLASVLGFIVGSQPWLGLLALVVVVPQAAIVVVVQHRINLQVRARVQSLRDASGRISEGDLAAVDDAVVQDFHDIFHIRRRIFALKLSSKAAIAAISGLGKVGILFLGGWLVLRGQSDVGTVVASLTGLMRIEGPWRDLVGFFRQASTVRVKYGMLAQAVATRPEG
jgi:ABC-type bacteriocin/lantibiotic exporter with double-glycine peptidase domain